MGNLCFGRKKRTRREKNINIMLVGLDNAGKSETAAVLAGERRDSESVAAPTVGFRPFAVRWGRLGARIKGIHLYDLGGGASIRAVWDHYYKDVHALIFVVDSADRRRLDECARLLEKVLSHQYISGKPVLILANKQDVDGAMDDLDIVERLTVESIVNKYQCPTRVESYSASVPNKNRFGKVQIDPGLRNGFTWLLNYVTHHYDELDGRVQSDTVKESAGGERLGSKNDSGIHSDPECFENPNYGINLTSKDSQSEEGIIVVKEAPSETADNVNLSPLFGTKSPTETHKEEIELEPRTEMRKLSPIIRKKAFAASHDEDGVSGKETSTERTPVTPKRSANEIFAHQLRQFKSQENLSKPDGDEDVATGIGINNGRGNSSKSKSNVVEVSLGDADVSPMRFGGNTTLKKVLPPIKLDPIETKTTPSATSVKSTPDKSSEDRPQSASDMVKRQLKSAGNVERFRLKGLKKNHTCPDNDTNLFIFDPDRLEAKVSEAKGA